VRCRLTSGNRPFAFVLGLAYRSPRGDPRVSHFQYGSDQRAENFELQGRAIREQRKHGGMLTTDP
jgi:hypothetical protein